MTASAATTPSRNGRRGSKAAEVPSETNSTRAVRDTARGSKNRTSRDTIKRRFAAAGKAATRRDEAAEPEARKKDKGDSDKGRAGMRRAFIGAQSLMRRRARPVVRALPRATPKPAAAAVALLEGVSAILSDLAKDLAESLGFGPQDSAPVAETFEWLDLWQDNGGDFAGDFDNPATARNFPSPNP
ncbi:MAG: hypothetical protein ACREET_15610 [Stellaceae bacterium]